MRDRVKDTHNSPLGKLWRAYCEYFGANQPCVIARLYRISHGFDAYYSTKASKQIRDAIIASLLRQNDVATSFWRDNDVIITSCVRRAYTV